MQLITVITTTAEGSKRDRARQFVNVAVHEIAEHFTLRFGNPMYRELLALE